MTRDAGSCLNNKKKPDQGSGWFNSKVDIIRTYKFLLTFENSNVRDYVTEKFNHALVAGTVPVYLGADTIRDFQPSPHSIINVQVSNVFMLLLPWASSSSAQSASWSSSSAAAAAASASSSSASSSSSSSTSSSSQPLRRTFATQKRWLSI